MQVDVREFYSVTGATRGGRSVAVAHREKELYLTGHGLQTGDLVKWVDGGSGMVGCGEDSPGDFVNYRDEEWQEAPTAMPSGAPSAMPSVSHMPSEAPSEAPSGEPSGKNFKLKRNKKSYQPS